MVFNTFVKIYFYSLFFFYPLSFKNFDQIIFYQIHFFALILFLKKLFKKEILKLPKKITFLWFCYSLIYLISCFLSTDKLMSFKHFFLTQSIFYIFIYFLNHKLFLKNLISKNFFYILSLIYINSFLLKKHLLTLDFINRTDYNLFYANFEKHNHLGDFLGLSIIFSFLEKNYFLSVLFFIFLIISNSRSAFFSLFSIFLLIIKEFNFFKKNYLRIKIIFLLILLIFFNLSISYYRRNDFFNSRQYYFLQGLYGFLEKPFFGWGYGNFIKISSKYSLFFHNPYNPSLTGVAHNIFLEKLTGLGIIGLIFFVLIITQLLKKPEKNIYYYLFLYLLILFQFDYIYFMPNLYLLFFLFSSLFYYHSEKS